MVDIYAERFPGLLNAISPENAWERPAPEDIEADLEGEQEAIPALASEDRNFTIDALPMPTTTNQGDSETTAEFNKLLNVILEASKAVTERTDSEYRGFVLLLGP